MKSKKGSVLRSNKSETQKLHFNLKFPREVIKKFWIDRKVKSIQDARGFMLFYTRQ